VVMKKFELHRSPFYRDDPTDKSSMTMMMMDPGSATKTVEVAYKEHLLQQMHAFGNELGRACTVSQEHIGRGPGFMKLPWQVTCCEENTPNREYGNRVCNENIERMRARSA
jgi:hypothetical protein